ncbi:YbaB/EbfC family nucleoid-associated protein [Microvirga massiliensis]|jgi:DNA-binding YbaB/EbfC family protein|uniref:YbaB/EbfC family nucleoid-associated protein n=1 Tax=Microvirga massiliensis TaxID=1033741 RepID=UPI00062B9319|nr:YbaB/EbfC family nucleoid-associated protein [Microvirga massiliensis]
MRDLMGIMKQAQAMQQKLKDAQEELENLEVDGAAGGGMVAVKVTARGQVKSVQIDPSLLVPDEKEILEDLLVAALNDARTKAERVSQERLAEVTKGLPLPPGLNLF